MIEFDFSIAGYSKPNMQALKPYYTKVMQGVKNLKGRVYAMSPEDYLNNSFALTDVKNEPLRNPNASGKFALPVLDIRNKKGLGRGRVVVCLKLGIKKIPVLVCGNDIEIKNYLKEKGIKARLWQDLTNKQ